MLNVKMFWEILIGWWLTVGPVLSQHSCSCLYTMGFPYVIFVCWHCMVVLVHQILRSLIACSSLLRNKMDIVLVTESWLCMRLNSKHHWVCEYSKRCRWSCIFIQLTVLQFGLYHTVILKLDTWSIFSMLLQWLVLWNKPKLKTE